MPRPIIQFANEKIQDNDGDLYKTMTESPTARRRRVIISPSTSPVATLKAE